MSDKFQSEFKRVFGSCNTYGGSCGIDLAYFADEWLEPITYDEDKASAVLARFGDGHGVTEKGDAEVCAALEAAGAVVS